MSAENGMFLSKFKKCKGYWEEVLESCKWHVINNILILRCSEPDMQFISPFLAKILIWENFHHIPVDTGSGMDIMRGHFRRGQRNYGNQRSLMRYRAKSRKRTLMMMDLLKFQIERGKGLK